MMNSLEESDTRADRAFAITRLFTLVRFSVSVEWPAVKLKGELVADDRLVSAPGEGHLNGQVGVLHQLLEAAAVLADADGQGRRQAAGIDHLVDGVQDVELLVHETGTGTAPRTGAGSGPARIRRSMPPVPRHPGIQPGVDLGVDGGSLVLRLVLHQVLIVVQQQHRHHRAAPPGTGPAPGRTRSRPPSRWWPGSRPCPVLEARTRCPYTRKRRWTEGDLGGTLVFALHEPAGIKVRDHGCGELGVEQVLPARR